MKAFFPIVALLFATPAYAASNDPLPPGAQHVAHSVEDLTSFDTTLSLSQVDKFYRTELAKRGWKIGDTVSYGTTMVLDVHKPPKAVGRITIAPLGPGKTHVIVSLSE